MCSKESADLAEMRSAVEVLALVLSHAVLPVR